MGCLRRSRQTGSCSPVPWPRSPSSSLAFIVYEQPGLGLAHFFYLSIGLTVMATGPRAGAVAGLAGTMLYVAGILAADRLSRSLAAEDQVARVGSDEFAVLASASTLDEAAELSTRLEWVLS